MKKYSIMFYIGVFGGCFTAGISSYRKTCFEKIMALEDSVLADQVREHMRK